MPTYTCWATADTIPVEARKRIADVLTEAHHEVAVGPRSFVQVVFHDLTPGAIYIAGQEAEPGHVWVRADIRTGRTDEQKQALLDRITTEIGEIIGAPPEEIWVYLNDIPGSDMAEYGRALPDPGGEDGWFAALPDPLRERLAPLG